VNNPAGSNIELSGDIYWDLAALYNAYGMDTQTMTPDFMLAALTMDGLKVWEEHTRARDKWMGFSNHLT